MTVCCDTSFLYSLYGTDAHSEKAIAILTRLEAPLTISTLNDFELVNALQHAAWRGLLTAKQVTARLAQFTASQKHGRIVMKSCTFATVAHRAKELAEKWTPTTGNRSFDLLHVAAALHLGAEVFLTFDAKQLALAESEGLATSI